MVSTLLYFSKKFSSIFTSAAKYMFLSIIVFCVYLIQLVLKTVNNTNIHGKGLVMTNSVGLMHHGYWYCLQSLLL